MADYNARMIDQKEDLPKVQKELLDRLAKFVTDYPKADNAPEALMQLVMISELMNEEAQAATESLEEMARASRDELDRNAGNEAAILERKHQDQLRRIEELARTAGNRGRAQAEEARRLEEQTYFAELARIKAQAKAKTDADTQATDTRIANTEREATARKKANGEQHAASGGLPAGPQRLELVVRNEQRAGSPLANLSQDDLEQLAARIMGTINQYRGLS
jgi:hypothetical protein